MKIEREKRKSLLIFALFLSAVLLFFYSLIIPMVERVYASKDKLEESKLMLKRDRENINSYKKDLAYLEDNEFLNEGLAVYEDSRVELIKNLEEMAVNENVKLEIEMYGDLLVSRKKAKEIDSEKTSLKLKLEGDYKDLLVLIYKLHNFKYVVSIEKVVIEKFDYLKMEKRKEDVSLEDVPEAEGEIIISFNEKKHEI